MWNKLKNLLGHKPDRVIGIDIGTGAVKLAEISNRQGRPLLKSYGIVELADNVIEDGRILDRAAVADALRKLIATSGTACRDAVLAVSGRSLFVREIVMPVMTLKELREAIKWELDKYVPYPPESCYFDFAVLGHGQTEAELRILLVIIPNERVDELVDLVREVGLKPVAIDIEPLALYRTLALAENSMVIDIGAMTSQFVVFQGGSPAVTRIIPVGGRRFTEAVMNVLELEYQEAERLKQRQAGLLQRLETADESATLHRQLHLLVAEIAREVRRTAEYYQIQNRGSTIDRLFITGGGARLNNFAEHLASMLDTEVVTHDPLAGMEIAASFDRHITHGNASQLAVAIGLSLRGGD